MQPHLPHEAHSMAGTVGILYLRSIYCTVSVYLEHTAAT
ncbi:hypothetical protein Dde_1167 [Oleidesulfovibrio alaskensis G20]|uniref:Uncharacterized protein n=1 Tax=Oleidesulfovibrio alaskensis (strain ATCC BAA-1058 / DSM 17464 / G20) TaxID=207559 RepID=Q313C8_OLEA2|nr:hypothetical protein Dde_1167 [Oleidesulfovibrio alaskensis G20]